MNGTGRLRGVKLGVRRGKVLVFSGCKSRLATGSLQPVAIGAMVEEKPGGRLRSFPNPLHLVEVDLTAAAVSISARKPGFC